MGDWRDRYDELHRRRRPMPGPWTWEIHDHSMATLCGGGEDAITGHIMNISPCTACSDRAEAGDKEWKWGRCGTPTIENARVIAAAADLLAALIEADEERMLSFELEDALDEERPALEREIRAIQRRRKAAIRKATRAPRRARPAENDAGGSP